MKNLLLGLLAVLFVLACNKKNDDPPVVDPPKPVVCEPGYHKLPGTESCVEDVKPSPTPEPVYAIDCAPFEFNGHMQFVDNADILANIEAQGGTNNSCVSVDGIAIYPGFGPCMQCHSIKPELYYFINVGDKL